MSDSSQENLAVEQLLAERDALHRWLERLEAATVTASGTVRERVRRDYQQQLDRVAAELRKHIDAIAQKLATDNAELAELASRTEASREELAEVELRHAVGEFADDRYEADRTRHLSDIETFELAIAAVSGRIHRMDDVLVMVHRSPVPSGHQPSAPRASAPAEMSILDLAPADAPATDLTAASQPADLIDLTGSIDIDQLASEDETERLLSIFSAPDPSDTEVADEPPSVVPSPPVPDFGPLSFRPSGAVPPREPTLIGLPPDSPPRFLRPGDRLPPIAPARSVGLPSSPTPVSQPEPMLLPESPPPVPSGSGIFSEEIVAAGPMPSSTALPVGRTLRCGECGAMNRPLEWYCEKCGAELSAV